MEPTNSLFGAYRLLQLIGEGGMGRVWKAVDVRLERVVALKILKGEDEERRRALVAEAKTACQLQHPNIAVVYEAGEVEGTPFIAMEYVEGLNLSSELGKAMPLSTLLNLAIQACKALHHAHQKGVVHRDIKPDNLVLAPDGMLKVLDFGVAKRNPLPAAGVTAQAFTQTRETEAGISVGTPSYMSPEQVFGVAQGAAADQFSLGTVLFELAAARHPFRKNTLVETLHAIGKELHPQLGKLRPDLPKPFVKVIERMLEKEADKRFPSLQEAQASLEPLAIELATGRLSSPPRLPFRIPVKAIAWGLGTLGLLAAAGFGAYSWKGRLLASEGPVQGLGHGRKVVAVLPVELEGLPPELAWAGSSFQDAMAMGLVRRGDLLVVDRLRVGEVLGDGRQKNFEKLWKELGADYLVVASLRGGDTRLRLSVRVVQRAAGELLGQFQVQGETKGLLEMEDELTQRLPEFLGGSSGSRVQVISRARFPRTRELYTKGLSLMDQGNLEAFGMARKLFEEALQSESDYAPARVGLAGALLAQGAADVHLGRTETLPLITRAIQEARKALALDEGLASGHRVLAEAMLRQGDLAGARTTGNRAVELDPADFRAHAILGDAFAYDMDSAALARAEACYRRALELKPTDWFAHHRLAVLLQNQGALEDALNHNEEARRLQPKAEYPYLTSALCRAWMGQDREARECLLEGLQYNSGSNLIRASLAVLAHRRNDRAECLRLEQELRSEWPAGHSMTALLTGLREDFLRGPEAMQARFADFLKSSQAQDWSHKNLAERRTTAVNLYHMAQASALRGNQALALSLLAEAERLHPGKRVTARKDPLLRGL
jgi:serine/threonine-protein kinase